MRQITLKLYKDLLRYGQNLKYTDQNYFQRRIRNSFKENKSLTNQTEIEFQLQKGQKLLENQRVV
ncbi:mitochondrial ribosome and complex I assembly factor AltMIEF1-like [Calliopsis andreniformis]|uniref:mitochondrial ribosome and complex I assembly factor AltMIEF1-like n=1 Tax=Calliopsis andreniformis TaxID=337506 RepID=UPI003FCDE72E